MKVYTKRLKDSHHFVTIEEKHRRFSLCREEKNYSDYENLSIDSTTVKADQSSAGAKRGQKIPK